LSAFSSASAFSRRGSAWSNALATSERLFELLPICFVFALYFLQIASAFAA
jgi:hypothetical protein